MPPEEIFSRFANRILVLTCDLSADDLKRASGVLVSADGFVVTNAHVVEGCRSISATQISGTSRRSYEAVLKYYDRKSDTAVLKIEGKGFESFGLVTRIARVGERVYAIGNPRGLEQSISEGIVSGLREEDGTLWIQHSAPISPGSSGGALISSRGELLGINSWFVKESQGLNFAVPASTVAGACSAARALQGFLRLPGSPPVSPTRGATKSDPPSGQNPVGRMDHPPVPGIVLEKARKAALGFIETSHNYVCQEMISRYQSESRPANWRPLDVVTSNLVFENGKVAYKDIAVNGEPKKSMEETGGTWSMGEFGTVLVDLFSPTTAADFEYRRESRTSGVNTQEYDFSVTREHSHWSIRMGSRSYDPPYKGSVWIDPQSGRVMRIEKQAYGLQSSFPTDHVESATDYQYIRLGDAKQYLLPIHAETLICQRGSNICSRNTIDFRNYRKYQGESTNPAERLVQLNVTVSDESGHRITNLPRSAFTVLENGAPQQIKIFKLEDVPVSMGLIIDNSGNMRDKRAKVKAAGLALVRDSNPEDEVFIVNFNDEAFLDLPHNKEFTNDIGEMEEALSRINFLRGKAMRDAIRMSIDHLRDKAHKGKNVLVVVTDGNDDASVINLESLVKSSQQSNVVIYAVGLLSNKEKREAERAKKDLSVLAGFTGGESFFPKDLSEVDRVAHQVAHDIRKQYTIAYTPSNGVLDGSWRTISVLAKGPGSPVARTLQGYYARNDLRPGEAERAGAEAGWPHPEKLAGAKRAKK